MAMAIMFSGRTWRIEDSAVTVHPRRPGACRMKFCIIVLNGFGRVETAADRDPGVDQRAGVELAPPHQALERLELGDACRPAGKCGLDAVARCSRRTCSSTQPGPAGTVISR